MPRPPLSGSSPAAPGARVGPYEIVRPLGRGGMGEVYAARDTRLDRTVAIKVLPGEVAGDAVRRERLAREARTIAALNHPHICGLHDIIDTDGSFCLVMQYLEGQTLADRLAGSPLPLDLALRYATEIADALDAAHRRSIVHRDLKPGNVMLTGAGALLLDFGLAKTVDSGLPTAVTVAPITREGTIAGTIGCMAPEQLEGRDVDPRAGASLGRSDRRSAGTGSDHRRLPFQGPRGAMAEHPRRPPRIEIGGWSAWPAHCRTEATRRGRCRADGARGRRGSGGERSSFSRSPIGAPTGPVRRVAATGR